MRFGLPETARANFSRAINSTDEGTPHL